MGLGLGLGSHESFVANRCRNSLPQLRPLHDEERRQAMPDTAPLKSFKGLRPPKHETLNPKP